MSVRNPDKMFNAASVALIGATPRLAPIKELSHRVTARLSQIDYVREMALVAQPADGSAAPGVARYSVDPDHKRTEFALAVRSDWHRRGLAWLLMTSLLDVA